MRKFLFSIIAVFAMMFGVFSVSFAADTMVAEKVDSPPVLDGQVDNMWQDVEPLVIKTVVADYDAGNDHYKDKWWDGYEGEEKTVKLRSVYTDDKIYFLFQWNDQEDSRDRQSWYYNKKESKWMQKPKYVPDANGLPPAYEDKFTMFWNISIENFESNGCSTLCHGVKMGTNNDGETADIWHWKRDRGGPVGIIDDKWLNNDENGRHGDPGKSTYSYNVQELEYEGKTVKAPKYWIPGREDYHWILKSEIENGTAKKIVKMDKYGNLVDEAGNTLSTGDFYFGSPRVIPSLAPVRMGEGSRADVREAHNFEDGMWTLEIVRARNTGDEEHDVQFTETGKPYLFSLAIMDNEAIAHSTPGGLLGTAYKLILK